MKLLKPSWVNHDGNPIFSVDIHPDGSRFATGGQGVDSGRVIIWNMAPVLSEAEEQKDNVPKLLCQMDNHLACVNCVRWSSNGKYLASGGDDKVVFIWSNVKVTANNFGASINVEHWRCTYTLRGHSGDILDLSWSPNDAWLASCSIDNSVIVWNTSKFPEIHTIIRGHTGLVKGICWDPVGKYIASQSDDKTLKIWRTNDWKEEVSITEPFAECGGTTHVLRLSWSPDGQYLVSAHAMNNRGSTSQIVEREGWKTQKDFVGHRKAVTCVRFNPNILTRTVKGKVQKFCCVAIGSRDRSISVWLTTLRRPLVVVHDLFNNSLLDISWSHCGQKLAACSWDGSVAFMEFEESEIGKPLTIEEKNLYLQKLYGKTLQSPSNCASLIEDAEILKAREEAQENNRNEKEEVNNNCNADSGLKMHTCDSRSSTSSRLMKGPTDKQIETRMPDGRRRITPLYIPPPTDDDGIPIPFNVQQTTFSSSSEAKTKIVIEKRDDGITPSTPSSQTQPNLMTTKSLPQIEQQQNKTSNEQQQVQNVLNSLPNVDVTPIPVVSSSSNNSSIKRKADKISEKDAKRKPGRPQTVSKSAPTSIQSQMLSQAAPEKTIAKKSESSKIISLLFPPLKIDKTISVLVSIEDEMGTRKCAVEVENNVNSTILYAVRLMKSDTDMSWEALLPSKINGLSACEFIVAVACEDNTLSVFSTLSGRRMHPPIVISSAAARLTCVKQYLMVITTKAALSLWDFGKHQIIVKNESLLPLFASSPVSSDNISLLSSGVTDNGLPLLSFSNGKSYVYDIAFNSWSLISNAFDLLNQNSDFKPPWKSEPSSFPLTVIQSQHRYAKSTPNFLAQHSNLQQSATISFIDHQLASAFVIGSTSEYRFWLLSLAKYLTSEGMDMRLREICQYLLGPPFKSSSSKWENRILGNEKHELLREVLSIMTSNLRLQRVYTEFKEQLEAVSSTNVL
ncbi:Protein HIRA-like protein [Dinothrombium tinctorium]|uniref:Protein HIRA n=1 Tax=Dinothrombium tinctorium TaxID=1965070 RepID=A0A443RK43_9ACAR|nr:Protein HIRA-like protein [Dinothrombium tinctorium]